MRVRSTAGIAWLDTDSINTALLHPLVLLLLLRTAPVTSLILLHREWNLIKIRSHAAAAFDGLD